MTSIVLSHFLTTSTSTAHRITTTFLADAPRRARALWRAAKQLGLARRTVLRAKKLLKIRHTSAETPEGRRTFWLLGGQTIADYRLPSPANLEPWLKPLRETYGKRCKENEPTGTA